MNISERDQWVRCVKHVVERYEERRKREIGGLSPPRKLPPSSLLSTTGPSGAKSPTNQQSWTAWEQHNTATKITTNTTATDITGSGVGRTVRSNSMTEIRYSTKGRISS